MTCLSGLIERLRVFSVIINGVDKDLVSRSNDRELLLELIKFLRFSV